MKTAVEWLVEQCPRIETIVAYNILEQAKEMEKEQVEGAYKHGQNNGYMYKDGNSNIIQSEEYYNETFKSE